MATGDQFLAAVESAASSKVASMKGLASDIKVGLANGKKFSVTRKAVKNTATGAPLTALVTKLLA